MSEPEQVSTSYRGFPPVFPRGAVGVNRKLRDQPFSTDDLTKVLTTHVRNCYEVLVHPQTQDGYKWFCGFLFVIYGVKVIALFPWMLPANEQRGQQPERSFALYVISGWMPPEELESLVLRINEALLTV